MVWWSFRRYPDQTSTRHRYERVLDQTRNTLDEKNREASGIQKNVDNVVDDKNRYNDLKNKYNKEYNKDDKILTNLKNRKSYLDTRIKTTKTEIYNTYSSLDGTKRQALIEKRDKIRISNQIDSIYDNTEQRNKDIYYGMNRTNNSLLKTITTTNNNHTADISKVTYQNEQSSYFSWLNNILLSVYLLLWIIFAFILYRIKGNIRTFIKVITIIALLLFPFLSIIYYKIYIVK